MYNHEPIYFKSLPPPTPDQAMHLYPTTLPCPPTSSIEFYPPPTPAGDAEHPRLGYPVPYPTGCGQHSSLVQPSWLSAANVTPTTGRRQQEVPDDNHHQATNKLPTFQLFIFMETYKEKRKRRKAAFTLITWI